MQGGEHRSYDGERADAVEQARRSEALGQTAYAFPRRKAVYAPLQVGHRAHQSAQRYADDEQHGELAFRYVLCEDVASEGNGGEAHGVVKGFPVFLLYPFPHDAPRYAAHYDAADVGDGSYHSGD